MKLRKLLLTLFASLSCAITAFPAAAAAKVDFCGLSNISDVPLYNDTSRYIAIWCDGNPSSNVILGPVASGWSVAGIANFDGTPGSDILLYNQNTNQVSIWPNGNAASGVITGTINTAAGYHYLSSFGDFNGDGHDDLIVYSTNNVAIWYSGQAATSAILGSLTPGWNPHMVADVDGDGHADLVLREAPQWNAPTGRYSVWPSGNPALSYYIGSPGIPWEIMAMGDFVPGGSACDILWYNASTGDMATSVGCGVTLGSFTVVGTLGFPVGPFLADDITGDGVADIVSVHYNTRQISVMQGGVQSTQTMLGVINQAAGWRWIYPYAIWYY